MSRGFSTLAVSTALSAAFLSGVLTRPYLTGEYAQPAKPPNAEATAAVRAAVNFMFGSSPTYPEADVTVGNCSPSTIFPGVMCLVQLTPHPSAKPEVKTVGFARLNGAWHSTSW